ncbi:hypothetical protein V5O48_002691 [Marasmius crinis-equi]|uniref:Major facilitator superfamily (MFS) profile domain-containing protein n=1 Tax=Marasmius crinis-equi TaxID=585013 RepID=A0ABR3FVN8_9AGAR
MTTDETTPRKRSIGSRISRIVWDRDDKSEEERKFVRRLDLGLMTIACLGYFIKYLDQSNINNAYVSGMKEDLNIQGDEYNLLLTMFNIGYVVGQYPGTLLMVKVSPSIWLPCCEIFWTILVMLCTVVKNVKGLYALRFFIGLAEASSYPGMLWGPGMVAASWVNELSFSSALRLLELCSGNGYLQAAVHTGLNGVHGFSGWQWLFIIDGVISFPIAIAGFFMIPDVPERVNPRSRWYLRDQDVDMAQQRVKRFNRAPTKGLEFWDLINAFKSWVPWTFVVPYTCYVVGLGSYLYMNLWLKSTGRYSTSAVNLIPTGGYGLQIVMALIYSWTSDAMGKRWPVIAFGAILPLIGNIILATWPSSDSAKFAGFYLNFTIVGCGALTLSWANELTSYNAEYRAITIGFLNTMSYVFNAWVPNLIFPASKAPNYPSGYKVTSAFFGVFFLGTLANAYLSKHHWPAADHAGRQDDLSQKTQDEEARLPHSETSSIEKRNTDRVARK